MERAVERQTRGKKKEVLVDKHEVPNQAEFPPLPTLRRPAKVERSLTDER
jgi:hypothetical protein